MIKILQCSAVTQTVLSSSYQKLWKLAGSRQSCCKNKQAYFFGHTLYILDFATYKRIFWKFTDFPVG